MQRAIPPHLNHRAPRTGHRHRTLIGSGVRQPAIATNAPVPCVDCSAFGSQPKRFANDVLTLRKKEVLPKSIEPASMRSNEWSLRQQEDRKARYEQGHEGEMV